MPSGRRSELSVSVDVKRDRDIASIALRSYPPLATILLLLSRGLSVRSRSLQRRTLMPEPTTVGPRGRRITIGVPGMGLYATGVHTRPSSAM